MRPLRDRRAFALIIALGTLAILGLIVKGVADSVVFERTVSERWSQRADERLALTWIAQALVEAESQAETPLQISDTWGDTPIGAHLESLSPQSPVYRHSALAPREGDRLATVTIGEETFRLLLRRGGDALPPTVHPLPVEMFTPSEEASP
ncbi:hypothetical protein JXA47_06065 [Candidatus Sumerlaeota bacterium]|nr:hypothetical protein [Candidatus Sumerlaeota bacterium]